MNEHRQQKRVEAYCAWMNGRRINRDRARKAVNLAIIQMIQKSHHQLLIIGDGSASRIIFRNSDSKLEPEEFLSLPVELKRIWEQLTFMSGPPRPWWHKMPLWDRLSFRITERIDERYWQPPLQTEGRMEFLVYDKPFWVTFKCIQNDRIELNYSPILSE
jgi:hypothetical protein